MSKLVCEHDRLARSCDQCELQQVEAELAAAQAKIRKLRLKLALATSKVTPWIDVLWGHEWTVPEAISVMQQWPEQIRLGDGTPEQEQP